MVEEEAEEEAEPRGSSVLILHLFRWVSFPEVTRGLTAFLIIFFFFFFSFPVHPSAHLDPRVLFSFPSAAAAAAAAAAADDDYNPVLRLTTPEEESNTCSIRSLSISPKFYEMPPGLCDEKHKPEEKKIVPAD